MDDPEPPISESDIDVLENLMGYKLPSDYRQFLLDVNGGSPDGNWCFEFAEDRENYSNPNMGIIHYFCSHSSKSSHSDLQLNWQGQIAMGFLGYVPIAFDPGGSGVVMSLRPDDYGCVYYADRNEYSEEGKKITQIRRKSANSFTEFMESLELSDF